MTAGAPPPPPPPAPPTPSVNRDQFRNVVKKEVRKISNQQKPVTDQAAEATNFLLMEIKKRQIQRSGRSSLRKKYETLGKK